MPEGPECKRMATQLERYVGTHFLLSDWGGRYKDRPPIGFDAFGGLTMSPGVTVTGVAAKGKFLYWTFDNDWSMWCTMGMSGTWAQSTLELKHVAMELILIAPPLPGTTALVRNKISFVDARHFGTIKFVKSKEALASKLATLGFDLLDKEPSVTALWWYLQDAKKRLHEDPIGTVLMDQSIFAGVGNYLRAEILYAVKMSPWVMLKNVTYEQLGAICKATREIMLKSYELGGSTFSTYKDVEGNKGQYTSRFAVYNCKTDPNGFPVIKEKTPDGRTIHWCPDVQKENEEKIL